jgi:cytochrome c553
MGHGSAGQQRGSFFGYNRRPERTLLTHHTMTSRKIIGMSIVMTIGLAIGGAAVAAQGNAAAGKQKSSMCAGCHGIDMYRTAFPEVYSVPKLGGQHASYIASALQADKSGQRSHPSMRAIAASLTEQDMADLAAYYSAPAAAK